LPQLVERLAPHLDLCLLGAVLAAAIFFVLEYRDGNRRHAMDPAKNIDPWSARFIAVNIFWSLGSGAFAAGFIALLIASR
jgi:hypothetical protein